MKDPRRIFQVEQDQVGAGFAPDPACHCAWAWNPSPHHAGSFSYCLGLCQLRQPPLSLSFLQAQLLKQFLRKLAFRKDEQSFYLRCTAVTLYHVVKPGRGLWLLRVSWGGKCGRVKQTKVRVLAGAKVLQWNQILYHIWGNDTHFTEARSAQSQDGAVALCFPKATFCGRKCRLSL